MFSPILIECGHFDHDLQRTEDADGQRGQQLQADRDGAFALTGESGQGARAGGRADINIVAEATERAVDQGLPKHNVLLDGGATCSI